MEEGLLKSAQILDVLNRREGVTPQSTGLEVLTVGALKRDRFDSELIFLQNYCCIQCVQYYFYTNYYHLLIL